MTSYVIQIAPGHRWAGCLAIVTNQSHWGVEAYIPMPKGDEVRNAYVRLLWGEFEPVGPAKFLEVEDGS